MKTPDFSKLAGFLRSAVLGIRKFLGLRKQQILVFAGVSALVIILALGFSLVGQAALRDTRKPVAKPGADPGFSLEGARVVRDLYLPGPAVGETPFPLAFEPDPGYTDQSAVQRYDDMSGLDITGLTARRKAELEAIYEALD